MAYPHLVQIAHPDSVLWHKDVQFPQLHSQLPDECDVVIVGGGYTGISAARRCQELGWSAVVLEANKIGTGASTRSGGMVIPELTDDPVRLEEHLGSLGSELYADVQRAFDRIPELVDQFAIDCDWQMNGQLFLAHNEDKVRYLRRAARHHQQCGEDVRFLDRDELANEIASDQFPAALLYARTGSVQPAKFFAGLLHAAISSGAVIVENTRALSVDYGKNHVKVDTENGSIKARALIMATNATNDGLVPELQRSVLPLGSFIIATEQLPSEQLNEISPNNRMMVDSRVLLRYWRRTPDNRIAFGGRKSLKPTTVQEAADHLYSSLLRIHPQLAGVKIDYSWGGDVGMTVDRFAHIGKLHRFDARTFIGNDSPIWFATGCNGTGVALMPWLGERLAETLIENVPLPSFAKQPLKTIPLFKLRKWWEPIVGRWLARHDALDKPKKR